MRALQVFGQLVSALVAVLGATGYILVLGAIVLWIRLGEAGFSKEVPLSFASREEMLVLGAQALAVWLVLALALVALAARLMTTRALSRRDTVVDVALGVSVSIATQAAIDRTAIEVTLAVGLVPLAAITWVLIGALRIRPPAAVWIAPLLAAGVGVMLPLTVDQLGDVRGPGTVLTAWAAFIVVLLSLPSLRAQRRQIAANAAAINRLEMERADIADPPAGAVVPDPAPLAAINPLLAALRDRLATDNRRFWLRGVSVGLAGLLMLGGIAVASQFEKKHLFRTAFVSLNTGRCVKATYISRNKENVVLGDQQRFEHNDGVFKLDEDDEPIRRDPAPPNQVVAVPVSEVLEIQVRDPTDEGVPMTSAVCGDEALIAPDGTQVEPFRGPQGEKGSAGPAGKDGEKGDTGDDGPPGDKGDKGDQGLTGEQGAQGEPGAKGDKGDKGEPGPQGRIGEQGPPGAKGDRGARGPEGPTGDRGPTGRRGPTGKRGPDGARGFRGRRGPRGRSGMD